MTEDRTQDRYPRSWLPGASVLGEQPAGGDSPPKDRQVNVRLLWSDYNTLREAASLYGVTPTTLARMLIKRGSRAIINEYRLEQRLGYEE